MINKSKKVIAILLCLIILLPSLKGVVPFLVSLFPSMPNIVYADDYIEQDRDKESQTTYYMVSNSKQFKELFDFDISDILGPQLFDWVFNFKTYTIIAKSHNTGDYTMYFNTPNLQSIVKNEVIGNVADGYTDDTYDINETEWIVDVGTDIPENEENIITKYGFDIPNYTYMGEYPKEIMSVAGIVPTKWYSILWNFIKGLLGFSFLDAPDASNFNTITYLNHRYGDTDYWVLDFFKKYYVKYFVNAIPVNTINGDPYFTSPEDFNDKYVSYDNYSASDSWKKSNIFKYQYALACNNLWNGIQNTQDITISVGDMNVIIPKVNPVYDMIENDSTYNPRNNDPDYSWLANDDAYSLKTVLTAQLDKSTPYQQAVNTYRNSEIVCNYFGTLEGDAAAEYYKNYDTQKAIYEVISDPTVVYTEPEEESTESSESTETSTEDSSDSQPTTSEMPYHEWADGTDRSNYTVVCLKLGDATISFEDYQRLCSGMTFVNTFPFEQDTIISRDDQRLLIEWDGHTEVINKYKIFKEMFDRGDKVTYIAVHGAKIPYKQCLIQSEKDGECYSTKYKNEKVTLSVGAIYCREGLYKELDLSKHINGEELTTEEAQKVIRKLQTICGPYYTEVLQNMVILMAIVGMSLQDTGPMELAEVNSKDARVMPYDVSTLVPADKVNYNVRDPRVELYKSHFIGALISSFEIKLGFGIWFKPQTTLIEWGGKITELSVKFQQLINFDWLEEAGLSPADMWTTALPTTMMIFLAIFFIAKTVIALFKMGTKASGKLIVGFIFFFLELGIITAIALKPKETWDKLKNINNFIMTFGEKCSPPANNEKTAYLFEGNNEAEILFYLPYIDMWSKYNTGYNLQDDEQYFDIEDYFTNPSKYPELKDIEIEEGSKETKLPKLKGKTDVKHYSIVLADAFSYYGYSASVTDSIGVSHETDPNIPEGVSKTVNGVLINNNAYRVVDHFMSPRVTINEKDEKTINFTITENENFNDEFQSGIVDMITKLLCCCLGCFLSLLKFITFLWFWWVLYIFIFRVMLGKVAEHKKWGHILAETFGPLLMIVFIGLYAGIVFNVVMDINGLIGLIFIIVVFGITFRLIPVWQKTANGLFFPLLLKPLADFITTVTRRREYKNNNGNHHNAFTDADQQTVRDRMANDIIDESIRLGDGFNAIPDAQETFSDLIAFTKQIFDENYNRKYENCHRIYIRWYKLYKFEEGINSPDIHDQFVEECYRQHHSDIESWIKNAKQVNPNDPNRVRIDGHEIDLEFDDLDMGSKTTKSKSKSKLTGQQDKTNKINQKTRKRIDKIELKYKKKHNKK